MAARVRCMCICARPRNETGFPHAQDKDQRPRPLRCHNRGSAFVESEKIREGLLTCFIRHTSASLLIQENADPDVLTDLENFMRRIVSRDPNLYRHTTEGPDDMPSHIRSALTA